MVDFVHEGTEKWKKKEGRRNRVRSWVKEKTEADSDKGVGVRTGNSPSPFVF